MISDKPKISVIVPVYNVEKYLRACLDSVVRQTLKDIEIICVDDGSTDDSLNILRDYEKKDPRVKVISQENGGYGKAMNTGLDAAVGEYMAIAEPDDIVALTMYEDLYAAAAEHDLDIVKSDYYEMVTESEPETMYIFRRCLDRSGQYYGRIINPLEEPGLSRINIHSWTGIYKISYLRAYGIRHHETPGASYQDVGFFWRSLMFANRVMILKSAYYHYRVSDPGSSIYDSTKIYAETNEHKFIEDIFHEKENLFRWEAFKTWFYYKKFHQNRSNIRRLAKDVKQEFVDFFSEEFRKLSDSDELDIDLFNEKDKAELLFLISDPKHYLERYSRPQKCPPRGLTSLKNGLKEEREKVKEEKEKVKEIRKQLVELEKETLKLKKQIEAIENSVEYKTGKMILSGPRKIRSLVR